MRANGHPRTTRGAELRQQVSCGLFAPRLRLGTFSRSVVASIAPLLLLGCDEFTHAANPEVPLWFHHPGQAMSVFISRQLTAESRKVDEADERAVPELDPAHRRVFIGSSDHGLYALSAVSGFTLWRFETAGAVQSQPLYDPLTDRVYFGSHDGAVYCLRAADGALQWRFATAAKVTRQPALDGDTLYVVNGNDYLIAITAESGKLRWYQHRTPAFGMEISGYAGPTVFEGTVYTAFSDGMVNAYSTENGSSKWTSGMDLTAETEQVRTGEDLRYLDVDTTPVVTKVDDETFVFVASYEGGLYALNGSTGAKEWSNEAAIGVTELTLWTSPVRSEPLPLLVEPTDSAESHTGDATDTTAEGAATGNESSVQKAKPRESQRQHRILIASSGLTGLWGFDPVTGKKLWRRDLPAGGVSKAVPYAGAVLVGTTRYGMFLISPLNGGVIDSIHSGGNFGASPAAYGLRAYALSSEGVFWGITLQRPPKAETRSRELQEARRAAQKAAQEAEGKEAEGKEEADKAKPAK